MAVGDWLPVASGTLLGLGGIYSTLRAGKRQQDTALAVARFQAEHQAELAVKLRHHLKLEGEYDELLTWAVKCEDELLAFFPELETSPQEWGRYRGIVERTVQGVSLPDLLKHSNVWSQNVRDWFDELLEAIGMYRDAVRAERGSTPSTETISALRGANYRMMEAVRDTGKAMRAELYGDPE